MKRAFFLGLLVALVALGCKSKKETGTTTTATGQENGGRKMSPFSYLYRCMQGEFSSALQHEKDSDFFDIRLRMVPVWDYSNEVFYLYVEQAVAGHQDKPYRQRFYKVVNAGNDTFVSYIYTVNGPERFTGKQQGDPIFSKLTPDSLKLKDGCEVTLHYKGETNSYEGSTGMNTCPSDRQGAAWATSKVSINESQMVSWDQGWDKEGKQVWGATKGGYIFIKQ